MRNGTTNWLMSRMLHAAAFAAGVMVLVATAGWAPQILPDNREPDVVSPCADGTIADGGIYGVFDGIPDDWDWTFDESGYEGAITLSTETPESSLEYRVVWEYDLSGLNHEPPVMATLSVTIRGAAVYPIPDADVRVYSFPADLIESPDDFGAGPAILVGAVKVPPYQEPTDYTIDVSDVVNEALMSGGNKVAFRMQINADTLYSRNQAFIDALDSEPSTKPYITVRPGDAQLKQPDVPCAYRAFHPRWFDRERRLQFAGWAE